MIIKDVEEKYNSLFNLGLCDNSSAFLFCYYKDELKKEIDIVPIFNNLKDMQIYDKNMSIVDKSGTVLLDFSNLEYDNIIINYVNNKDLIISNYSLIKPQYVFKRMYNSINHYVYDEEGKKIILKEQLYKKNNNNRLVNFEIPNNNKEIFLIESIENLNRTARLYSVSEKKYITPKFTNLEIVENTKEKLFKYNDIIKSSLIINGITFSSNIIGFITIDGIFYNGVYDELTNKEIECDLNNKPDFQEYYSIRNMIEGKLNEKVVKESNKQTTKEFVLKKLENKAKKNF